MKEIKLKEKTQHLLNMTSFEHMPTTELDAKIATMVERDLVLRYADQNVKYYYCKLCKKDLSSNVWIRKHLIDHMKYKSFRCLLCCDLKFRVKDTLLIHLNSVPHNFPSDDNVPIAEDSALGILYYDKVLSKAAFKAGYGEGVDLKSGM